VVHIPNFLPNLRAGAGSNPERGGCLMQVTSYLYNEGWTDKPECTDKALADIAISINDAIGPDARRILLVAVPDLIGTAWFDPEPEAEDAAITALDEWARSTFPYGTIDPENDDATSRWIDLAERIELAVSVVSCLGGAIPEVSTFIGYFAGDGVNIKDETQTELIAAVFGRHIADAVGRAPADWRERQAELAAWFVAFVRKYREVFGEAENAVEVKESDWRRVAERMVPA
jgi:hypothetical protein